MRRCKELEKANVEDIDIVRHKLNGSLIGMFLMYAQEECNTKSE